MAPDYVPPENPHCVEFDGSLVPDCGKYLVNNVTSYYHIHEYNCSRFWECGPQGACLFECASCPPDNDQCMGEEALWFDCKYQFPEGPVCDWPNGVDCTTSTPKPTNVPTTDPITTTKSTTTTTKAPTTTTTPEGFCLADEDCSNTPCSSCENQQCVDPECCEDANCPLITEMSCSVCTVPQLTCTDPECCTDSDCEAGFVCQDQVCVLEGECDAQRPCEGADEICNLPGHENCQYCSNDLTCENGCGADDNCPDGYFCGAGGDHWCGQIGLGGVKSVTIKTLSCSQCAGSGNPIPVPEGGVKVHLIGAYGGTECTSDGLDNIELVDYDNGITAVFDGLPDDDGDDDGLGACKGMDLNIEVTGGTATWTAKGTWTGVEAGGVCVNFYCGDSLGECEEDFCCCDLASPSLGQGEESELVNCQCVWH